MENGTIEQVLRDYDILLSSIEGFPKCAFRSGNTYEVQLNVKWIQAKRDRLNDYLGISDKVGEKENVKERILKTIKSLNERDRLILVLYYMQGLSLKEICKILNIPFDNLAKLHSEISKIFLNILKGDTPNNE